MTPTDTELREWYETHKNIYEWSIVADNTIKHGNLIIHYNDGKITGCDMCPRLRYEKEECK